MLSAVLWVQEAPTRLLKIYLKVNPILTCDKRAMFPEGSIKIPGPFFLLVLLDQDTENVPVCRAELLDRTQPREAFCPRAWHSGHPTSPPGPRPWSECRADPEVQTPRLAGIPSLRKEREKVHLPQHWNGHLPSEVVTAPP